MYKVFYPERDEHRFPIVNFDILEFFDKGPFRYYAFPQKGTTIAFIRNAEVVIDGSHLVIKRSSAGNCKALFLGKYIQPLTLVYEDFVEEIAVNFTETGINYYFPDYYTNLGQQEAFVADSTDLGIGPDFSLTTDEERIASLEESLARHFNVPDTVAVEKAITLLRAHPTMRTKELAEQLFLTEKTLNRQFQRYVGCTTSRYKQIVKFRNTIDTYFTDRSKNLTELCMENDYFDSPHFNKEIRKMALFNPKEFFKQVTPTGQKDYPYIFH